jgi:hypothetical protein
MTLDEKSSYIGGTPYLEYSSASPKSLNCNSNP